MSEYDGQPHCQSCIDQGSVVGICGMVGSGKTSLISAMLSLVSSLILSSRIYKSKPALRLVVFLDAESKWRSVGV